MGWTFMRKPTDPKADLDAGLTWTNEGGVRRVLKSAIVNFTTYYAAVEHVKPTGERNVWAAVYMVSFNGERGYEFGYKDMTEHMGPTPSACPSAILNLLTPLEDDTSNGPNAIDWGNAWRQRSRATLAARANKRAVVRDGAKVSFKGTQGWDFGGGLRLTDFVVSKRGAKTRFQGIRPDGGLTAPVRLQGWNKMSVEAMT